MLPADLDAARQLVRQALLEDLNDGIDVTTSLLIAPSEQGTVQIVARQQGVLSGGQIIPLVFEQIDPDVSCRLHVADGTALTPGMVVATLVGSVPALLTGERTILNFLTLLSGVASLTRKYVAAVESTQAKILDTRKTLPGLRTLQKYAVRCGGGTNHRIGLYDAVLVKDNHLAAWRSDGSRSLAEAVRHVRKSAPPGMTIEFEVDTLDQLREILPEQPDIVLLDNMTIEQLAEAVRMRNELAKNVLLEASGGVNLQTVGKIAATGVDRISIGALTHSAPALDLGFDWV
ncbi:carboxylating nicotinate-nucleotide diphosphorylase [Planctomicrobium piriforme]|uniref:Probable nicotinate-nucleotide pyrophosphorylase [carboxylating] n=1 Tax=Planctomicrobium piriforme TaxID=1576369 RepID=A0A1I3SB51_9PLAN|nr:carboxylating nicotinate-nucleotide diphosphorylase [Planctomicrobium piriforme]SFJ54839.1 nicotinate-nucleotide pyrophosphorylase (carboxylating) [Planctomicrobium piriforme]